MTRRPSRTLDNIPSLRSQTRDIAQYPQIANQSNCTTLGGSRVISLYISYIYPCCENYTQAKERALNLSSVCPLIHVLLSRLPAGESSFIKSLVNFDKDNISDRVLKKTGQYCTQADFQPEIIGRVSLAAKSLCMWVRAMEVREELPRSPGYTHGYTRTHTESHTHIHTHTHDIA